MKNTLKRTWAEIDLDNLAHNYKAIRSVMAPGELFMAVVKANAYGHGVDICAVELDRLGTDWFAVSNIEEALELRRIGIQKPILILGYTPPECAEILAENNISQAIFSLDYARQLSAAAADACATVNCHIKLDTGMGRIGFNAVDSGVDELPTLLEAATLPGLTPEGLFTHFAAADEESGRYYTEKQFKRFTAARDFLTDNGINVKYCHCCNSAATLLNPEMHLDMCRPGIILYGLAPAADFNSPVELRPVMQLKSVVSMVKCINAGRSVSYGMTYTAPSERTIATVPIGYADGYSRGNSGKAHMIINGKKAPVVGRVCMDQTMLDVTDANVRLGDTVTVFGNEGGVSYTADDLAALNDTINYEIACNVGKRVPRIYFKNGRQIG